ncbi:hypothetical protein [Pelagibacterium halotolerans]|uniref:hypothetical protein n=1 Tax=Pelagibacterium halotolerans TaxID=531813 RepID=UPI00385116DB
MIVPQAAPVILHRMALIEARELSTTGALVAKFRGDAFNRAAIERLNAVDAPKAEGPAGVDKTA